MSGIVFTTSTEEAAGRVRDSVAVFPDGSCLTIGTAKRGDMVELALSSAMQQSWLAFTAAQARSVAAELLACADARDAAQVQG